MHSSKRSSEAGAPSVKQHWFYSVFLWTAVGALFYWASLPPLRLPWAAYLSSACWIHVVANERTYTRRDYVRFWLISSVMWLALLQGIRLAFWPLYAGWVALSLYVAVYLPLFIYLARALTSNFRLPIFLACPMAWMACELIRAYFATGFSACMLGHSQTPWPWMLQIASHFGGYGVGFVVMLFSATLYCYGALFFGGKRSLRWPEMTALFFSVMLSFTFLSWNVLAFRLHAIRMEEMKPVKTLGRILLVQENMPTVFNETPESVGMAWLNYERLTKKSLAQYIPEGPIDLVIWPESVFSGGDPFMQWIGGTMSHTEETRERLAVVDEYSKRHQLKMRRLLSDIAPQSRPSFLVGTNVVQVNEEKELLFNSVLWIPGNGDREGHYSKKHLVMFGEYIPIVSSFPQLLSMIGMGQLSAGESNEAWQIASGAIVAPSICFEDVVPQLIQSQIADLSARSKSPDILVNVTNDGWFRGSSILDHHLNNAIMVAVENRRPMLIAANTGITAWIDGSGIVVESLPRLTAGTILAEPIADGRWGLWQWLGDYPARFVTLVCCLAGLVPMFGRAVRRAKTESLNSDSLLAVENAANNVTR